MNRQEAWELLNQAKSKAIEYFWGQPAFRLSIHPDIFVEMVDLLKPHTPDPITGLVPCGCGERVSISFYPGWAGTPDLYQVDCFSCHVGTRPCQTAEQAKAAWNTAMGWRAEE